MKPLIKVENLSKQYRLGTIGTGTIRDDMQRWWHKVRGKEDPYLKIGETNDRSTKGNSDYVWALKDINFEVMPGEVLGIIGKNGAGKSTLLKILSKVTGPTTGRVDFNGRIGSLLEVGTGFHPDLTGRENIFLNGAILGMTKREIKSKLDEIIDFSGCERYIDTPVKRYSSGMTVRLGFAVAVHLDPEILVVDEVLAVGDAEFQKKAIGKMQDVSKNEGRTILFVSHNLQSMKRLCTRGIILNNGEIHFNSHVNDAISLYLSGAKFLYSDYQTQGFVRNGFTNITILNYLHSDQIKFDQNIKLIINYNCYDYLSETSIGLAVINNYGNKLFTTIQKIPLKKIGKFALIIPHSTLLNGHYSLDMAIFQPGGIVLEYLSGVCAFEITDNESENSMYKSNDLGNLNVKCEWSQI